MDLSNYRQPTEHALINQFAIRCFREIGDGDYIAARMAMRARLAPQFLWSAEQAVEKYLKCILMLNREDTRDLAHDIRAALERINQKLPFTIELQQAAQEVFDHLVDWSADRYLVNSLHLFDREVLKLDMLVWHLRQFCVPLDVAHYADEPSRDVLLANVARIQAGLNGPRRAGYINGLLENVARDRKHPAHNALVWRNLAYSGRPVKRVRFPNSWQALNSPLFVRPDLADEVAKYMRLPRDVIEGARVLAAEREREKASKR